MLKTINLKQMSFLVAIFAFAAARANAVAGFKPDDVRSTLQSRASLNGPTANCSETGSCLGAFTPSQACTSAYNRLYEIGKDDLDFRIFVSYWDTQPEPGAPRQDAVIDNLVKNMFSEILREPCYTGLNSCGFVPELVAQDTRELEHLSKTIIGPDGKSRTIHLTIESSSVSDSNYDNHHAYKTAQKEQSEKATDDFIDSLSKSDVILYTGHARWGTGPGFKAVPSKLSWAWMDQGLFKPSRRRLDQALKSAHEKPKVIGYFACTSEKYYSKHLEKDAPKAGLALTEVATSDMESQVDTLGALNALLGLQCEEDFKKTLEFNTEEPDAEILDFFKTQN